MVLVLSPLGTSLSATAVAAAVDDLSAVLLASPLLEVEVVQAESPSARTDARATAGRRRRMVFPFESGASMPRQRGFSGPSDYSVVVQL